MEIIKEYFLPDEKYIIENGLIRYKERTYKMDGTTWEIHLSDVDDWQSIPHAHNKTNPHEVLNLYTGEVFDNSVSNYRKSSPIYIMKKKSMKTLHRMIKNANDEIAKQLIDEQCIYLK